jgi:hypothetical protein
MKAAIDTISPVRVQLLPNGYDLDYPFASRASKCPFSSWLAVWWVPSTVPDARINRNRWQRLLCSPNALSIDGTAL